MASTQPNHADAISRCCLCRVQLIAGGVTAAGRFITACFPSVQGVKSYARPGAGPMANNFGHMQQQRVCGMHLWVQKAPLRTLCSSPDLR